MAKIGQALTKPESGWVRYDDKDKSIWTDGVSSSNGSSAYYLGTQIRLGLNDKIKFNFTGSNIRIISRLLSSYSNSVEIKINNDIVEYFSAVNTSAVDMAIVYEKHNLDNQENSVEIINKNNSYFYLDAIDIDENCVLKPYKAISQYFLIEHNGIYIKYSNSMWETVSTTSPTEAEYLNGNLLKELLIIPQSAWKELNGIVKILYYTDNLLQENSIITVETEPFSVYDYISETPEVLVYTESTDDITVSTTTEPFEIYDELGDSVEVLYYTDDTEVTQADLVLEANYSPIDELEGDFEVVTWTDEEDAERVLEMTATPKPQIVKLTKAKQIFGAVKDLLVNDISESYNNRNYTRFFVCEDDTAKWKVWSEKQNKFILVDTSTEEAILKYGMTANEISSITKEQWENWDSKLINIGVFLKDNVRDTIHSVVESISYSDTIPRDTTTIGDTSFYILNTTAKIDLALNGSVLTGVLSDDDLTRVQYRVLLNGAYYYPADGSFTKLGEAPQNIEIAFSSNDIKIGEWNTVKVEFQDFFGTVDYWSNQFMGTYSGLLFKDVYGQYYSNEIGEVLQYLDFGIIIAGQTTVEHEIILANQYGYDIKNIHLFANTGNLPRGMSVEFSQNQTPFVPHPELKLSEVLPNNKELPFFVRLKTELGVTPDANGTLDIIVKAEKA